MSKYKTTGKQTLFDAENAARKLSDIGNPLEKLDSVIDFDFARDGLSLLRILSIHALKALLLTSKNYRYEQTLVISDCSIVHSTVCVSASE